MATIEKFEDIEAWKLARVQALEVFKLTQKESFGKDFALKNQMNNAAGSAMDNIAEGFERSANGEFQYFLCVAKGSNGEVRSQLYRVFDRGYCSQNEFDEFQARNTMIGGKVNNLSKYLSQSQFKGQRYNKKPKIGKGDSSNPTEDFDPEV